jgi:F-type H+-transporting ATPase subunit delta
MKSGSVSQTLVNPYAEALMAVAKDQNLVEEFGNNVQWALAALSTSEDLQVLLGSPLIKIDVKKAVVRSVFESQIHPTMLNFLMLLIDRQRIVFLEAICLRFQDMLRKLNRVALAEVTAAVQLTESQEETLKQKVRALTQSQSVELSVKINPELIGGVIIKVGSQIIDASIRGQLRRLSNSLIAGV